MDTATKTTALVTKVKRSEISDVEQAIVAMVRLMACQYTGLLGSEIIQQGKDQPDLILVQRLVDHETANSYMNSDARKAALKGFCDELQVQVCSEICPIDEAPKHQTTFQDRPVHWSQRVQENALEILLRLGYRQPIEKIAQDFALAPKEAQELHLAARLDLLTKAKRIQLLETAAVKETDARNWYEDLVFLAHIKAWSQLYGTPDAKEKSAMSNILRFTPTDVGHDEKGRIRGELFKLMEQAGQSFEKGYPMDSPIEEILKSMVSFAKSKKLIISTVGDGSIHYSGETMRLEFAQRRLIVNLPGDLIVSSYAVGTFDIVAVLDLKQLNPRFIWQSEDFDNINSKQLALELLKNFIRAVDRKVQGVAQTAPRLDIDT